MRNYQSIAVALGAVAFIHCGSRTEAAAVDGDAASTDATAADAVVSEEERPIAGLAAVWAVHDGEKVERDDLQHPARSGNTAWREGAARIFGGRNEIVAFQVVIESDEAGIEQMDVDLASLTRRGGGGAIVYAPPGDDPSASVGRPIQIFTENYMNVTAPTQARWLWQPGSAAAPADPVGWKPVQLVPENARQGRGGLPIDIAGRRNQAIWIEVYIPRGLAPGMYDGAVELRASGGLRRVPVELEVFDFELPDEGSMTAMIYFEPGQVSLYQGRSLTDRYHRFAHRHRIELVNAYSPSSLSAARGRFDGSHFTAEAGYDGPGAGVGNTIAPASFYGPGSAYDNRASAWTTSDAWMAALATNAPNARTFLYMPDEPGASQYPRINTIGQNIDSNPGPGRALPVFVTSSYESGLDGAIDIWCSSAAGFDPSRAATERAKGKKYWFYNGTRPETGALTIDAPATDPRVNAWAAFKHGVETYFYWHADHWEHNFQKQGERKQNVWANTITFDNRGQPNKPVNSQGFIHGDGVVLYPGEEVLHPDQDRGIAGPIGSIQLANLRRGVQDHLYLSLARQRGLDAEVSAALAAVVPAVFSEAGSTVQFAQTGDVYEAARYQLARALGGVR
ncbi:MAG: Heparinase II/III-like protein [Myxococcales bacterium]|nr:Heparinase II/III-like protein [Myxococcales bacterium]